MSNIQLYTLPISAEQAAPATSPEHGTTTKPSSPKGFVTSIKIVGWDGPDDPQNPKNWTLGQKWAATFVVSGFTLLSPVSSSIVAPALEVMGKDLNADSSISQSLMLSIFILAYAIGPLVFGPLSEIYGRVPVLQLANLWYLFFNLGCGFAQNGAQMMVCRFFAGLGGSAPLAIGGGVLSDCWHAEQRGRAISAYSLAPMLGPAIGPIAGGFIAANTTWRWIFWATCLFTVVIQIIGAFLLKETYAPKLLKQKAQRLRKETGDPAYCVDASNDMTKDPLNKLKVSLSRPFIMLGSQPIIIALAIYMVSDDGCTDCS